MKSINFNLKDLVLPFLLILGLLNPASRIDYFFYFVFALICASLLLFSKIGQRYLVLTYVLCLLLIWIWHRNSLPVVTILIVLGTSYYFIFQKYFTKISYLLLIHLIVFFLISSFYNSQSLRQKLSQEPQAKTYSNDYSAYLRIYYLHNKGYNYYDAFVKTHTEDARSSTIPAKYWAWRLPTYLLLWNLMPFFTGISIYFLFMLLSTVTLIVSYQLGKIYLSTRLAIILPYILMPYFHFAAKDLSFLAMEWWALGFYIIGLYFLLKDKLISAFCSITMAVLLRETFIVPILIITIYKLIFKRMKEFKMFTASAALFLLTIAIHYLRVSDYIGRDLKHITANSHPLDFFTLNQTLAYASNSYLLFRLRPFFIFLLILPISILSTFVKKIDKSFYIIPISASALIILVLKNGTKDADYWGAAYVPLLIISVSIAILNLAKLNNT